MDNLEMDWTGASSVLETFRALVTARLADDDDTMVLLLAELDSFASSVVGAIGTEYICSILQVVAEDKGADAQLLWERILTISAQLWEQP